MLRYGIMQRCGVMIQSEIALLLLYLLPFVARERIVPTELGCFFRDVGAAPPRGASPMVGNEQEVQWTGKEEWKYSGPEGRMEAKKDG